MQRITVTTREKRQVVDITDIVEEHLVSSSVATGVCSLLVLHTTAALTTADLDPGTDVDMLHAFEPMIPKLRYRHPHNPAHVGDHIVAAMTRTSGMLPLQRK